MSDFRSQEAGSTNTRSFTLVAKASGSPITSGTVNWYLKNISGANAGKWWRDSDQTWQVSETANAMTHQADGHWTRTLAASPWTDGDVSLEYAKESGDLHIPICRMLKVEYTPSANSVRRVDLGLWLGSAPDALSSGKIPADVKLWLTAAPAALTTNGYLQAMLLRWLTDNAGGTPNVLQSGRPDSYVGAVAASAITAASIATDAITAAKIAADAIGASELASDAVAEIQSGLATASALATVQSDTDDIQTRLPAALVSGRMDSSVGAMQSDVVTASAIATDAIGAAELAASAVAEIQSGLSTLDAAAVRAAIGLLSANLDTQLATIAGYIDTEVAAILAAVDTEVAAIKAKTDNLPASPAATGDAMALTSGERSTLAGAILDLPSGVETGLTPRQALRLTIAALAGKLSGAATTTITIRNYGDSKSRIVATVDADGNRSAISYDLS